MANVKITQLPLATTPLTGTEDIPLVQGTTTKQVTVTGLFTSPVMTNPTLGTVGQADLINATGLPISTGVAGLGTGVATFLGTPSSANLRTAVTDETGTGSLVFATSPTLVTPNLGTPTTLVATNATGTALGLTAGSAVTNANLTGAVTSVGNATSLGSFTSAQLITALTDETGSGSAVFSTSPTLVTPALGTPSALVGTNITGTATNFNINGTVGATTPSTVTGTTITANTRFVGTNFDASGSGGGALRTSSSANVLQWGGGGGVNLTLDGAFNMNPANASISIAPTGTGTLTINPATAGTINNMAIGGTTPAAGAFTTLSATSAIAVTSGGTGQTSYTDGQLLIGNSTGNTLTKATLTAGTGVTITNGSGAITINATGTGGDVVGPASATDNAVARFDSTTGKLLQNSVVLIGDTGAVTGVTDLTTTGNTILGDASTDTLNVGNGGLVKDASGNVGIGTSSPAASTLTLSGKNLYLASSGGFVLWDTGGQYGMNSDASTRLSFFSGSATERMRLDSSGNLGLGVTPSAWGSIFDAMQIGNYGQFIAGRADSSNQLHLGTNSFYSTNWIYTNTAPATRYVQSAGAHEWFNAASGTAGNVITFTQAMTLDASNRLLIGTTSASGNNYLQVNSDALVNGMTVGRGSGAVATNTTVGYQALYTNTTSAELTAVGYQAGYANTTGQQNSYFGKGAGIAVSTGWGNLLVGNGAGNALTTGSSNTFIGGSDGRSFNTCGQFVTTGSKNVILGAFNGNQGGLDIRTADNYLVLSDGAGNLLISTNSTRSVALNGAVPQTGTGITFPATQSASTNANTLDDYEEGTWTPSVGGTATYGQQQGSYIKVGRLVTVSFDMAITLLGTGSTSAMSGLPFTVGSATSPKMEQCTGAMGYVQSLAVNVYSLTFYAAANGTTIFSISMNTLGGTANVNPAIYGNSTRVQGTVTYMATT